MSPHLAAPVPFATIESIVYCPTTKGISTARPVGATPGSIQSISIEWVNWKMNSSRS